MIIYRKDAGAYLETLFVSAIASILVTRFYLQLTNYPRLGMHGWHIAHMLWGGLFLLAANIILIAMHNPRATRIAAILGGAGFGLFIDELGKYITNDNNYFFAPATSIIYVIFVLLFLVIRFFAHKTEHLTDKDAPFKSLIQSVMKFRGFGTSVILFFIGISLFTLVRSLLFLSGRATSPYQLDDISDIMQFGSSLLSSTLAVCGALVFFKFRKFGYRLFRLSLLTSIFLTEVFDFYNHQLDALFILVFYLITLVLVNAFSDRANASKAEK